MTTLTLRLTLNDLQEVNLFSKYGIEISSCIFMVSNQYGVMEFASQLA